jgi:hypothetical protein
LLAGSDHVVSYKTLIDLIDPNYPKTGNNGCKQPYLLDA